MSQAVEVEGTRSCKVVDIRGTSSKDAQEAGRWVRFFTQDGIHPFDEIEWKIVDAKISRPDGSIAFEQKNIEVPSWWNNTTIGIVADKYFRVINGVKENSAKQMFRRVSKTLRSWAEEQGYFNTEHDARIYEEELCYALLHQYGAFNSPVWFNLGVPNRKQIASACFISGIDDTLNDIMEFQRSEVNIFAGGSGSGANYSNVRSSYEKLSSGSYTSGVLSWVEGLDRYAKAMKSGGSTRNAAKMVVLDMDHPDILETKDGRPGFIRCKAQSEKIAHDLAKIGYSVAYDDPNSVYKLVPFQNANNSVSIPDRFMNAVENDEEWYTTERTTGNVVHSYKAKDLWKEIAEAAWICGDPGVQFTDTINEWHTTPKSGRIKSSNPCFSAGTRIATEFGLIPISDLYERVLDGKVRISIRVGDRIETKEAIVFPTGMNPIVRVEFRSGRVLEVTPNHEFLLRDGSRKPASELVSRSPSNDGDTVDIQCEEGMFGNFDCGLENARDWYRIAGFVIGDGWMTAGKAKSKWMKKTDGEIHEYESDRVEIGMCFGKDDKDCLETVKSFLDKNEINYFVEQQKGFVGESPDYLRIRRIGLFRALEQIACPAGSKSSTKRIQPGVFEASKENQFAFLAGYLSAADATFKVSAKGHGGKIPTRELRLASINIDLLRDVQALLLNLGIKSTIMQNRNELFVYGHSLRKLRDGMISSGGMLSSRKQSQMIDSLPSGYSEPIHDVWHDEVVSVTETGRHELTYNMTEFDTHTIIAEGVKIPQCSEFLHIDNTACNLAALNLTKFFEGKKLDFSKFSHVVRILVTAQNAIINMAEYPTQAIAENSKKLRPIGLNYGNLGSLIMKLGYGYDSNEGRAVAARMASLMTGLAYGITAKLAARVGPFPAFAENREQMLGIMHKHATANAAICSRWGLYEDPLGDDVSSKSSDVWKETIELGKKYGYVVSQTTLQAPLGTLSFLMEMDTTGIEPMFSLVSYKSLVGGGSLKLVCASVEDALTNLGYSNDEVSSICDYIRDNDCIEGAPGLKSSHLSVFDGAMPSGVSGRCLSPISHVQMLAAIQPLITCSMSKTVNLPESATPEEIADIYYQAWKLGVKCIALYRDKCKLSQPLASKSSETEEVSSLVPVHINRRKLPSEVTGTRHRFEISGCKGYIMMNDYPDGSLGEVFLKLGKTGSTVGGLIDGFTQLLSLALQYGVPLDKIIRSFIHTKFDPSGFTDNPQIRFTDSLYDYLCKVLDIRYYGGRNSGLAEKISAMSKLEEKDEEDSYSMPPPPSVINVSAPMCSNCGSLTRRVGTCHLCPTCGTSSGCS